MALRTTHDKHSHEASGSDNTDEVDGSTLTVEAMELLKSGKVAESEAAFGQALALNETRLGVGHTLTLSSVVDFSRVQQYQGRLEDALRFCRLELSRAEKIIGKDALDLCLLLADLASIHQNLGQFDKAVELLRRELSIREKDKNYVDLIHCLYTLGSNVFKSGNEVEGISLCRQALETAELRLGPDHYETVCALYFLGECHQVHGDYRDSLTCYRQALSIMNRRKMTHPLASSIISSCSIVQRLIAAAKDTSLPTTAESEAEPSSTTKTHRSRNSDKRASRHGSSEKDRPLPDGWEVLVDDMGEVYYFNSVSKQTQTHRPKHSARSEHAAKASSSHIESVLEQPLPDDWLMKHTSSGRPYFIHKPTKQTTWGDPRLNRPGDLPTGWEMALDKHGVPYYIDLINRRNQREKPSQNATRIAIGEEEGSGSVQASSGVNPTMKRRGSFSSIDSLSSLISTVSSLSMRSFHSAKALFTGDSRPTFYDDCNTGTASLTSRFWWRIGMGVPSHAESDSSSGIQRA